MTDIGPGTGSLGMQSSYYERIGAHRYRPTRHAGGAWQPDLEQHMAPVAGLLMHEVELHLAERRSPLVISRVSYDILGRIDAADLEIAVRAVRPGRTIELLEATMTIGGRAVVQARVWLLASADTSAVAGGQPEPLPAPAGLDAWAMSTLWPGGYIESLEVRPIETRQPGRGRLWVRSAATLVAGEPSTDLARYITLIDTANGVAVREAPDRWMFPNVDLTVHLYRQPIAGWVGLDVSVVFGADRRGLTTTVLHDAEGPIGRAEQILTVRPLPAG